MSSFTDMFASLFLARDTSVSGARILVKPEALYYNEQRCLVQ